MTSVTCIGLLHHGWRSAPFSRITSGFAFQLDVQVRRDAIISTLTHLLSIKQPIRRKTFFSAFKSCFIGVFLFLFKRFKFFLVLISFLTSSYCFDVTRFADDYFNRHLIRGLEQYWQTIARNEWIILRRVQLTTYLDCSGLRSRFIAHSVFFLSFAPHNAYHVLSLFVVLTSLFGASFEDELIKGRHSVVFEVIIDTFRVVTEALESLDLSNFLPCTR